MAVGNGFMVIRAERSGSYCGKSYKSYSKEALPVYHKLCRLLNQDLSFSGLAQYPLMGVCSGGCMTFTLNGKKRVETVGITNSLAAGFGIKEEVSKRAYYRLFCVSPSKFTSEILVTVIIRGNASSIRISMEDLDSGLPQEFLLLVERRKRYTPPRILKMLQERREQHKFEYGRLKRKNKNIDL